MKSIQRDISAGGDIAGHNIYKTQTNIIHNPQKHLLTGLIEKLKDQIGADCDAREFVDRLSSWMSPKKTRLSKDLQTKLTESGQGHLISDALEAKERFTKQLKKTAFNPALQEIYAHILGEIHTNFIYKIKPKIQNSQGRGEIESEIVELGERIAQQISEAPAELGLGLIEIVGMLYYLTGNCYVEWIYDDPVSPSH